MPTLAEIRAKFPQYGDLTDEALSDAIHKKFYSDVPKDEFDKKLKEPSSPLGDFFKAMPAGAVKGFGEGLSAIADLAEGPIGLARTAARYAGVEDKRITESPIRRGIEAVTPKITEQLPTAKGTAGAYGGTVAEFLANPISYAGPGGAAIKAGTAVAGALGSEALGQASKGSAIEPYARVLGAVAGGGVAAGAPAAIRSVATPAVHASADLGRALERDGDTMESLLRRLTHLRSQRPGATVADAGGENVRGLVERLAQTPGAGRTIVIPAMIARQQGQLQRISTDLRSLTGTDRTAIRATQETMAARAAQAQPVYMRAYEQGDFAVWSPDLERLSSSPAVQAAMRIAVRNWRDTAIAEGYGAANPAAMVDRGGQLTFLREQLPVFPNLQFWDYTKRSLDGMVQSAMTAGQRSRARILTRLASDLRTALDREVPAYAEARNLWAGPSQYLDAIESGSTILERSLSGEQLRADLAEFSPAQREGHLIGAVSAIVHKLRSDPSKLPDLTKYLRSPEMREKIEAIMPTREAADSWLFRLDAEIRSSELTGQSLKGSPTARRLAEREDAESIAGDLVMGALAHGPTLGLLKTFLTTIPGRVRDSFRSRSDRALAEVLLSIRPPPTEAVSIPPAGRYAAGRALAVGETGQK